MPRPSGGACYGPEGTGGKASSGEGARPSRGASGQAGQGDQLAVFLQALVIVLFKNVFTC